MPAREGLELHALDLAAEKFVPLDWPSLWSALKDSLERRRTTPGGAGPFADPSGALLEFPVFDGGRGISEWLVLELDLHYVRRVWLPELVRAYLDFDNKSLYDVEVKTVAAPGDSAVFLTPRCGAERGDAPFYPGSITRANLGESAPALAGRSGRS